jgi:hypothetical protein
MRLRASIMVIVLGLTAFSSAWAADEGQTQPRLDKAQISYGQTVDLVPLTSGSGNVKGIQCKFGSGVSASQLHIAFSIDGGTAQSIQIPYTQFSPADSNGIRYSDFIPMNLRFETSIRIQMTRSGSIDSGNVTCVASWALD